jgi:hypothetical protein
LLWVAYNAKEQIPEPGFHYRHSNLLGRPSMKGIR